MNNALVEIYVKYVINGTRTIESVPELLRDEVEKRVEELSEDQ